MKHQLYFPSRQSDQLEWLRRFRSELSNRAGSLELPPEEVADTLHDVDWLIHLMETVMIHVRGYAQACTASLHHLMTGKSAQPVTIPALTSPAPPSNTIPPPGVLKRLFSLVQWIKKQPAYTREVGQALGIVGNLHTADSPVPKFKLRLARGSKGEAVKGTFQKFSHVAVYVETRRGLGDWETLHLGMFPGTEFLDDRPLLEPGKPEVREYRLCFWEDDQPTGLWSKSKKITVSP